MNIKEHVNGRKDSIFKFNLYTYREWKGDFVALAGGSLPPIAGVPSLRLCHSMWVSWWTCRSLGRFFSGFLPFFPATISIPPIYQHSTQIIYFIDFYFISSAPGMIQTWSTGILAIHRFSI